MKSSKPAESPVNLRFSISSLFVAPVKRTDFWFQLILSQYHHSLGLCGHSLVAPGCDSQYESEEEDGASDGPDNDVGAGDTWGRQRWRRWQWGAKCVLIDWVRLVVLWAIWSFGGNTNHKTQQRETIKHQRTSGKGLKGREGIINWKDLHHLQGLASHS